MKGFFGRQLESKPKIRRIQRSEDDADRSLRARLAKVDRRLLYSLPRLLCGALRSYFRLEISGLHNIPAHGHAIIAPNHSGWSGFDAIILRNEILQFTGRKARILAHPAFFLIRQIRRAARRLGLRQATTTMGLRLLENNKLIVLFPEGEDGNFKPTAERYRLREFKRGFVRLAMLTGAPIIPTIIIGAEESHINLATINFKSPLRILPLPLNVFPLPAKWRIRFLDPIHLDGYTVADTHNVDLVHEIALSIQKKMQDAIDEELHRRKWIFFAAPKEELRPAA